MTIPYQRIFDQAAQLATQGRFEQAGESILTALKLVPSNAGSLTGEARKLAFLAASYYAKSNNALVAVELYLALGEREKAAVCLEKTGDILGAQKIREGRLGAVESLSRHSGAVGGRSVSRYTAQRLEKEGKIDAAVRAYVEVRAFGDAARLLHAQGKLEEAANMYAEAGQAYEAGRCFLEIGDTGKALDNFVRVPRDGDRYRRAAVQVVALAEQLGLMNFAIDNFLGEFVRTAPQDPREIDVLYHLARLYEGQALYDNAKEVLEKIQTVRPGYRDVAQVLQRIERYSAPSAAVYARIREQESGFRGGDKPRIDPGAVLSTPPAAPLPDLPPAPDLPELRPVRTMLEAAPAVTAPPASPAAPPSAPEGHTAIAAGSAGEQPAPQVEFAPGNTIADRYRIVREIGRGGMAAVFLARDLELDEDIALKLFLTQVLDPQTIEESTARFKQELKLSRKLSHPNIIRLYDIGMYAGFRYISMELLRGTDLETVLARTDGPYDYKKGIRLMIQACAGLDAAHRCGVVHRDIKPENMFVCEDGTLKIMDFGIAKNTAKPGVTQEGMMAGTPHYIAPEQISAFSKVGPQADLYSLGVTMYRMFCGAMPFDHEDLGKLLMMHLTATPPAPSQVNPHIPPALESLILALLEKDPTKRIPDARTTAVRLQQAYAGL